MGPTGLQGPTRHQAAGPRWRRTSYGRYVPADVDSTLVEQRIVEQAGRLGGYGAVTAWAALRWWGARFFDGVGPGWVELPVPLVTGGSGLRPDPRFCHTEEQLAPSEWTVHDGIRCTTIQRALFDEVRRIGNEREAATAVSMVAAARLTSVRLFAAYVAQRNSWTGIDVARRAVVLASDDCRSPQEHRMLLAWTLDAGLDPPLCNRPVYGLEGRLIGIPDLFDPVAGLVGEYQGADHKEGARHRSDVAREEEFRNHGLEYFELVGGDLEHRGVAVDRMLNARARAKFLPPESCAWTLEPPPWVTPREGLEAYLLRTGRADRLWRT